MNTAFTIILILTVTAITAVVGQAAREAARGEAPFIVSLKYNGSHFCAGSIVHRHWVLTAAHCLVFDFDFQVVAGLHERLNETQAQVRTVAGRQRSLFLHPQYKREYLENDIGLVYIEQPFDFSTSAGHNSAPVAAIAWSFAQSGTTRAKLYGWNFDFRGVETNVLQVSELNVVSLSECMEVMPIEASRFLPSDIVCTLTDGQVKGPCNTDSGSPLVSVKWNGGAHLLGIASGPSYLCELRARPAAFTRVSDFRGWIEDTISAYTATD